MSTRGAVRPDPGGGQYIDPACSRHIPVTVLLDSDSLPLRRTEDGVLVATSRESPDASLLGEWFPGERLLFERAERHTVQNLIIELREEDVADEMANAFTRSHPAFAARTGIRPWQKAAACAIAAGAVALLAGGGAALLLLLLGAVLASGFLFKVALGLASARRTPAQATAPQPADSELPGYTVLIPAYHEAAVIGDTVRCIAGLDYPEDKLEVLVLVERPDEATARAVREVDPPDFVRIVPVPPGLPQTKPRTCNLGLMAARGELLVIFDAEDRPERDQLRKIAAKFAAADDKLACIQAKLNFYNARRNPLTRLFSLEFAFWFDLMLAGLARLRLPVPLGGTSNHFRTDVLRSLGGWDAWNVTEDADLGLRLASMGYRVEVADSTTWEECPSRPWAWIRQRTRWLMGYMLTVLVHTRQPVAAVKRFGLAGMVSLYGLVWLTPVVSMLWPLAFVLPFVPEVPFQAGGVTVDAAAVVGSMMWITAGLMAVSVSVAARRRRLGWAMAVCFPLYWLLHAFAGWRGLLQLVRDPYRWEKTSHGPSAADPADRADPVEPEDEHGRLRPSGAHGRG
ncbi:glycosyltransferase [Streptomyces sp. NPDC002577]